MTKIPNPPLRPATDHHSLRSLRRAPSFPLPPKDNELPPKRVTHAGAKSGFEGVSRTGATCFMFLLWIWQGITMPTNEGQGEWEIQAGAKSPTKLSSGRAKTAVASSRVEPITDDHIIRRLTAGRPFKFHFCEIDPLLNHVTFTIAKRKRQPSWIRSQFNSISI